MYQFDNRIDYTKLLKWIGIIVHYYSTLNFAFEYENTTQLACD